MIRSSTQHPLGFDARLFGAEPSSELDGVTPPQPDDCSGCPLWAAGFETIEAETPEEVELAVKGQIPTDVAGTLYRVGPARHEVGGARYRHWFDGDGMVHALRFAGGRLWYRSRFVQTKGYLAEREAGRRLFGGGFSTPPPGGPFYRLRHFRPKNAANINVVHHGQRLWALWEGGRPHRLDPDTLDTIGEDDLGGILAPGAGFSAHPKYDPETGELWNFGVTYGSSARLSLYRGDEKGRFAQVSSMVLRRPYMVHDMALTERFVIIVLGSVALPRVPLLMLAGYRGYGESLRFWPTIPAVVMAIERATGRVERYEADPFMVFHLAGAREEAGALEVECCTYPDATVIADLARVMKGDDPRGFVPSFDRLTVSSTGKVQRRAITSIPLEFPRRLGPQTVVGVSLAPGATFLGQPALVDTASGSSVMSDSAEWEFAGEVVPLRCRFGLTVVFDGRTGTSELKVLDLERMTSPPVARAQLPYAVPFGLHGNFVSA